MAGAPPVAGGAPVEVTDLSHEGDGVARLDTGEVVFVAGALPGERVELALGPARRGVRRAEAVRRLRDSPARVAPRCANFACGGCALRTLAAPAQGEHKRERLLQALLKIGRIDARDQVGPARTFGDGWGRRHRARLHLTHVGGAWRLGYHRRGSREVVPVAACPVLTPPLEQLVLRLGAALAPLPASLQLEEAEICYSHVERRGAGRLRVGGDLAELRRPPMAWLAASGLSAVDVIGPGARLAVGNLELRVDHRLADQYALRTAPGLFAQGMPEGNDLLTQLVCQLAVGGTARRVLELFAGTGNLTAALARAGAQVVAYEGDPRAAALCRRNNQAAGLDVQVVAEDAARAMEEPDAFDVVVLDPPRAGAAALMPALARRGQARIVYVSCDPATLARDARVLVAAGWRLGGATVLDMFPQTPHLETVAFFER